MAESRPGQPANGQPEDGQPEGGWLSRVLAPVAGFGVTFTEMFRKTVTEQYPFEKKPPQPRYHGRHQLNRHPDGLEKCVGCELCAWACPADAIYVEGADNTDEERYSPGERYGRVYQINYLRCIFCGLCIEACPTRAGLIYEKPDLLAPLQPGMVPAPHPMVPGTTERDYYQGKVTEAADGQRTWAASHGRQADESRVRGEDVTGAAAPSDVEGVSR